jgi:ubiquitin C-terminal hydrolase
MRSEIANILSAGKRHQSSGRQRSESACYSAVHLFLTTTDSRRSIKRSDKSVVLLALLSRILHRVLLLDGAYSGWQADEPCEDCGIPMGVIVSCVDTPQLVRALFDVSTMISEFQSCGVITATAFRVFAEDGLRLLFGLLASADDGGQIVRQQSLSLSEWIVQMSVRNECFFSRGIVVWRIFELCANLSNRCTDGCFANDGKPSRVDLLNFIIDSVKVCCGMGGSVETNHLFEQLYSLMAGLLWLSGTQHQSRIAHISGDGDMSISNKDKRLVEHFVSRLVLHNSSETFHSAAVDGTLRGLLRVLLVLASKGSSMCSLLGRTEVPFVSGWEGRLDLVKHLYSRCLFPQNDRFADAPPLETLKTVYQTADSRRLATTLLLRLCDCDPLSLSRLLQVANGLDTDLAVSHTSNFSRKCLHQWNYDPNQLAREVGAQVGLSNQGGTCYMNAFLQQLYHIPSFVDGLLAINRTSSNDLSENEAMLFQLQVMFGSMRLSQRRYYDTLPFCRSFIDYDGQPVNLGEQKDINEFAGMLFDKLEHNKDCAALLADTLQGTMVWKTRSTESAYRSEREEPFYMITVEVKDKGSLEGSLELTVAEELFSGDNRIEDSDGRKVEALRRCAIRQLPPTLIVHLKRFEFDLETMHRKKVNDRISFPTKLDMFPYTEQGLATKELLLAVGGFGGPEVPNRPTDEFQYSLKGVVAHVGAIDRGHYYSFIKSDGLQGVEAEWREYNDRSVLPFSSESLERECFGGADDSTGTEQPSRVRENSAYLLIYERVSGLMCSEALSLPGFRDVDSPVTERSVIVRRPKKSRPVIIAEAVEAAVWRANMQFQTDRFLFDSINIQFILQLLHVGGRHPQLDGSLNIDIPAVAINCFPLLVMTGLRLVLEVVVRARVRKFVHMYFSRLEEIILADSQTGKSAEAVIDELTRADIDNSSWLYPGGLLSGQSSGGQSKYQVVLDATQRSCHPWLLEMMMYCPHGEAALSFSRVLITCVKVLRPFQNASYLLKIEGQHVSSISKLVCCLMVLLEKLLPDDAGRKDG